MTTPHFTEDWFSGNIPVWEAVLGPKAGTPLAMLEVGSFQGRSALWALENVLTHPDSVIHCCDTFEGTPGEHTHEQTHGLFGVFSSNLLPHAHKVHVHRGASSDVLKRQPWAAEMRRHFDVVYIDGDHRARAVLEDAVLAFPLLKPGGIMIFDDYMGGDPECADFPKVGIDAFVHCYADLLDVMHYGYQLVVRRREEDPPQSI